MYNLDEEQTALKVLETDTYENLIRTNSDDAIVGHSNFWKVRMASPHFCL